MHMLVHHAAQLPDPLATVKNFCRNVYRYIAGESKEVDFATFEDGHIADCIVEAVLESHKTGKWVII